MEAMALTEKAPWLSGTFVVPADAVIGHEDDSYDTHYDDWNEFHQSRTTNAAFVKLLLGFPVFGTPSIRPGRIEMLRTVWANDLTIPLAGIWRK